MEEEIEKVSGIGTVTEAAEKAVEAFGEKTLEELTEENKRLQEENERLKNRSIKNGCTIRSMCRCGPLISLSGACAYCLWLLW